MQQQRTIQIKLNDGKDYTFSERYKIDNDFFAFQERLRKSKIKFIQENILDKDDRLALLVQQMNKIYSTAEVASYISSSKEEQYLSLYNSFKIKNKEIGIDEFKKLVPESELSNILQIVTALEAEDENVKKKEAELN